MSIPIILVDDNEADRYLIARSIEECDFDHQLYEFEAGDEFLEVFTQTNNELLAAASPAVPALILLDINMPRMSGFEVLERLAQEEALQHYFVVLMVTSSNSDEDRKKSQQYQFLKDFAVKPISEDNLSSIVATHYPNVLKK